MEEGEVLKSLNSESDSKISSSRNGVDGELSEKLESGEY